MSTHTLPELLILRALRGGRKSFDELLRSDAQGLYPPELRLTLAALESEGVIHADGDRYAILMPDASGSSQASPTALFTLVEPHPHDCDWRFHSESARALAEVIARRNTLKEEIILLGAPRLFVELMSIPEVGAVTLVDWNEPLLEHLVSQGIPAPGQVIWHDLLHGGLMPDDRNGGLVVCDPPWYVPHYIAFLTQASALAKVGAEVFVSMLPIGTRPGAAADRDIILGHASLVGLHIKSLTPAALRYDTPLFERASLERSGLSVPEDWRASDLLVLQKLRQVPRSELEDAMARVPAGLDDGDWLEARIGMRKLKVRRPLDDEGVEPQLIRIESDDVLPTVSRRYPGRARIDLWLWDNRVYGVRGKAALWAAMCERSSSRSRVDVLVEERVLAKARALLDSLLSQTN